MLNIILYKKGIYYNKLEASGHAGFAEKGSDIVCAGASSLLQTMLIGLKEHCKKSVIRCNDDNLSWNLSNSDNKQIKKADFIITLFMKGIEEIRKLYPGYIKIKIKRERYKQTAVL